jgi:signal transduction histidine kinase
VRTVRPEVRDLREALATVRAVAAAGQGDYPFEDVLDRACRAVSGGYGFERVAISRLTSTEAGEFAVVVAAAGVTADVRGLEIALADSSLLRRACERRELVYSADAVLEQSLPSELVSESGIGAGFALPLLSEARCIGLLSGDHAGLPFELDEVETDVLNTIGVLVATLLEKELLREQMRRLDEAKTQFIALASHELRTPIQIVYGVVATLHHRGSELREEQLVELRGVAYEQAERLRRLAEQLLDLSRIDAAATEVRPQATMVRRKLEEIVLLVAEQRAGDVLIEVPPDLEVELDPHAFDRILSNLLINALRYGAAPIRLEAAQHDRHLRLRVADAGEGVAPEFVPSLFERFSRSEHADELSLRGSGLGLAIAQSFARAHGGEILYHPVEPHGACFELVLPMGTG